MKDKIEIKLLIKNIRDELNRSESVLSWLCNEHPDIYSEIQDSELGDILVQDISNDIERTEDLTERIDFAMLMSACVGDVAIPTINQIYEKESEIVLPYKGNYVDTETVYNTIDEWCYEIKKND